MEEDLAHYGLMDDKSRLSSFYVKSHETRGLKQLWRKLDSERLSAKTLKR